ncbi:organelle RRM domain-containing protein 1, chloroplastic-like [Chenopodium quinoa]|uniref:RRM domain-containing protein n=1 Tax=Chenopodium quinoa TaxID=63459 RepID=A0A803KV96_CHEQI|nr:organelle RRM domain-containing protein 1, chloroplastic-like [Chenopodium quinoa]
MVPLHSPLTTINLSSISFPPQKLHYHQKSPFSSSKISYPLHSFISSNSFKLKKENSFQVSLSFTQQNSNDLFNNSLLLLPNFSFSKLPFSRLTTAASTSTPPPLNSTVLNSSENVHWMVKMDKPPNGFQSKAEIINYYVSILEKALGSERDAQSCIYDASCDTNFGFCCIVDEETSRFIAGLPGVLSVIPDPDINSVKKDYSARNFRDVSVSNLHNQTSLLYPKGSKNWLVRVEKPSSRVLSKAQAVDSYVNILTRVLGNEKDAQMCRYHVSWQSNFGFCCKLDDESAQELATVAGVISVRPDEHFESENKDYGGDRLASNASDSTKETEMSKTKLFITGLSFYTSEKTLREAFEPFGELVEVKVIMDKISKRSKGYAFVEYTTEVAATTALHEMNGKIINGWMIVVDRAKMKPQRSRALSSQDRKVTQRMAHQNSQSYS